jgi:hypothetical protein
MDGSSSVINQWQVNKVAQQEDSNNCHDQRHNRDGAAAS